MPALSEFGDAATMIDGPSASSGYASGSYLHAHGHSANGRAKGAESASARGKVSSTFARTPDYFSEDRPFVVLINGKRGVLGALEDLDAHLRTVRPRRPGLPHAHTLMAKSKGWTQQDSFG